MCSEGDRALWAKDLSRGAGRSAVFCGAFLRAVRKAGAETHFRRTVPFAQRAGFSPIRGFFTTL